MTQRTGIWIVGAYGDVATCVAAGLEAVKAGLVTSCGLVTDTEAFASLDLVPLEGLVIGGYDIRATDLRATAEAFARQNGVPSPTLLTQLNPRLAEISRNIKPGLSINCGEVVERMASAPLELDACFLRDAVQRIQNDLAAFKKDHRLDAVIVVNLASAEAKGESGRWEEDAAELRRAIDRDERETVPASVLYAFAALDGGHPYINFTSSMGSSCRSLDAIAVAKGVPHMGKDGKTGETLVKSVLAPMFRMRNLRVLAWESHNILGNRDGQVLNSPLNKVAKIQDKNDILRKILQDDGVRSNVRIDYVPSLGDWKTAWDFIHFAGFLDTRMTLQFTWQGSDSLLAAPLVLDLVRLTDHARRQGLRGSMSHLASFFKNPYAVADHDFTAQFALLESYVRAHCAARVPSTPLAGK